ncbi:MAG: hypothetical protein M1826_001638 [Phylliscum demangeonii]|nr:MAG: hypothetical protein M1826_001638 [Phylliscum demangeonii]
MTDSVSALLDRVRTHLSSVEQNPQEPLDRALLERFADFLTAPDVARLTPSLLPQLLSLLPLLQQDPDPLCTLILSKFLPPLSFKDALSYTAGPTSLADALRAPFPSTQLLAIEVVKKAASNAGDTAVVAGWKDVVSELISAFLLADTAVSLPIRREVLESLLITDHAEDDDLRPDTIIKASNFARSPGSHGQGLLWRRLFEDRDIYSLFFTSTGLGASGSRDRPRTKNERTVAQSRVLDLLPTLVKVDFNMIRISHFPDVESTYGLKGREEGLLDYAAIHMVDFKEDVLMHMVLLDFFVALLEARGPTRALPPSIVPPPPIGKHSSLTLDYLISKGLHARAMMYFLYPNSPQVGPLDRSLLTGGSANYIAAYARNYPHHILAAKTADGESVLTHQLNARMIQRIGQFRSDGHHEASFPELVVLAALPRLALLPDFETARWRATSDPVSTSPVFHLPLSSSPKHLDTLGQIFQGLTGPHSDPSSEAMAARALCIVYYDRYPDMIDQLVLAAKTIALKERALAAIGLLSAISKARWAPLPTASSHELSDANSRIPTEDNLRSFLRSTHLTSLPSTGIELLLSPSAESSVMQYLMSPPQTFSNLVGGTGDAESAAYKVAVAKFQLLVDVRERVPDGSIKDLLATAAARGPWGGAGAVGGHVATMEM